MKTFDYQNAIEKVVHLMNYQLANNFKSCRKGKFIFVTNPPFKSVNNEPTSCMSAVISIYYAKYKDFVRQFIVSRHVFGKYNSKRITKKEYNMAYHIVFDELIFFLSMHMTNTLEYNNGEKRTDYSFRDIIEGKAL